MINGKVLLQNAIGALIEVDIIEKISLEQIGSQKPVISLYTTEAKDKYSYAKPIFFLETGIRDVVAEVKMK
jgi:hypothetical protein